MIKNGEQEAQKVLITINIIIAVKRVRSESQEFDSIKWLTP